MTEIPGSFPKKVCPETFVSNHTGPIRIAEDQMQRLMRCILAGAHAITSGNRATHEDVWAGADVMLEDEPNINKDRISELEQEVEFLKSAEDTLRVQIKCLQSNLDAANDRAHMAEGRAYSLMCDYNRCKKEAELEVERLKAQVSKERACVILRPYGEYYELLMTPIIFGDRESATKWAEERGLDVAE